MKIMFVPTWKKKLVEMVVGIEASRNHSGGANAQFVGIFTGADPKVYGISEVYVWAYKSLIDAFPDYPWLVKLTPLVLEKALIYQVCWQYLFLPREDRKNALLYETHDELKEILENLCNDKNNSIRLGKNAYELYAQDMTLDKTVKGLIEAVEGTREEIDVKYFYIRIKIKNWRGKEYFK